MNQNMIDRQRHKFQIDRETQILGRQKRKFRLIETWIERQIWIDRYRDSFIERYIDKIERQKGRKKGKI